MRTRLGDNYPRSTDLSIRHSFRGIFLLIPIPSFDGLLQTVGVHLEEFKGMANHIPHQKIVIEP